MATPINSQNDQPSLFEDHDALPPHGAASIDDQIAAIGALPSKRRPEDDSLSTAHAEATGVQVAWEGALSRRSEPHTEKPRKLFELPGKDGRSNNLPNLRPHEVQRGMTDDELDEASEMTKKAVKAAREILDQAKNRQ